MSKIGTNTKNASVIEKSCPNPFVSVITVVFRDLNGLKRTKSSVFMQSHFNFEWIVVDGGSEDGTVEFLNKIDDTRLVWLSERDTGIYNAMNKGIALSSGEYIVFLNAGDVFPTTSVLEAVRLHLATMLFKCDVLFGGASLVFQNGFEIYRKPLAIERYIWHGLPAIHQATYYKKDRISDILYDLTYRICGDYYIIARLYNDGIRATYLDMPLVNFQIGGVSYRSVRDVYIEPYLIQKKFLMMPFWQRLVSLFRRVISKAGTFAINAELPPFSYLHKIINRKWKDQ